MSQIKRLQLDLKKRTLAVRFSQEASEKMERAKFLLNNNYPWSDEQDISGLKRAKIFERFEFIIFSSNNLKLLKVAQFLNEKCQNMEDLWGIFNAFNSFFSVRLKSGLHS